MIDVPFIWNIIYSFVCIVTLIGATSQSKQLFSYIKCTYYHFKCPIVDSLACRDYIVYEHNLS